MSIRTSGVKVSANRRYYFSRVIFDDRGSNTLFLIHGAQSASDDILLKRYAKSTTEKFKDCHGVMEYRFKIEDTPETINDKRWLICKCLLLRASVCRKSLVVQIFPFHLYVRAQTFFSTKLSKHGQYRENGLKPPFCILMKLYTQRNVVPLSRKTIIQFTSIL